MCTVAMSEALIGSSLDQLSSSLQTSDDLLSEFDLEQTADLLSVSSSVGDEFAVLLLLFCNIQILQAVWVVVWPPRYVKIILT